MTSHTLREMPHAMEAEQAMLGSILVSNAAYHRVAEILRSEHFADPMHANLFEAMATIIRRGMEANVFGLKAYIDSVPTLKDLGGMKHLAALMGASVHVGDVESLARTIRDAATRRGLIAMASDTMSGAYEPNASITVSEQIEQAERRLYQLAEGTTDGGYGSFANGLTVAVTQAEAAHKRRGQLAGVTTGLKSMDALLGGLQRSDLIILAGRPSMGKTALATNMAVSAALAWRSEVGVDGKSVTIDGARVGFCSLEMSTEQLATRIIAERSGISSDRVRKGNLTTAEFDRFLSAAQEIEALPFFIDETPALTISALRSRARRLQRQHGLDLLVIDYLQMITPDTKNRNTNRVGEVSEITSGLKALAKELNIPVLALSQLSRKVEERTEKKPQLADLRDSGSIEQDADVVMFVYREEYYLAREGKPVGDAADRAEVLVEKHRHGPIGNLTLKFEGWLTRFSDVGGDAEPEAMEMGR